MFKFELINIHKFGNIQLIFQRTLSDQLLRSASYDISSFITRRSKSEINTTMGPSGDLTLLSDSYIIIATIITNILIFKGRHYNSSIWFSTTVSRDELDSMTNDYDLNM